MNLNFGIPLKRQKKEEKYDFAVLTMQKEPEIKKGARRFLLNKAAFDLLGLNPDKTINETLSIGFPQQNNGHFVIAVTTNNKNVPNKFKYMVHKTENSFSDLVLYNAIQRELSLDNTNDVDFILEKSNDIITFRLLVEEQKEEVRLPIENAIQNQFCEKEDDNNNAQIEINKTESEEIIEVKAEVEEENLLTLN